MEKTDKLKTDRQMDSMDIHSANYSNTECYGENYKKADLNKNIFKAIYDYFLEFGSSILFIMYSQGAVRDEKETLQKIKLSEK